jgi:hypothetical protein
MEKTYKWGLCMCLTGLYCIVFFCVLYFVDFFKDIIKTKDLDDEYDDKEVKEGTVSKQIGDWNGKHISSDNVHNRFLIVLLAVFFMANILANLFRIVKSLDCYFKQETGLEITVFFIIYMLSLIMFSWSILLFWLLFAETLYPISNEFKDWITDNKDKINENIQIFTDTEQENIDIYNEYNKKNDKKVKYLLNLGFLPTETSMVLITGITKFIFLLYYFFKKVFKKSDSYTIKK